MNVQKTASEVAQLGTGFLVNIINKKMQSQVGTQHYLQIWNNWSIKSENIPHLLCSLLDLQDYSAANTKLASNKGNMLKSSYLVGFLLGLLILLIPLAPSISGIFSMVSFQLDVFAWNCVTRTSSEWYKYTVWSLVSSRSERIT